MRGKTSEAQAMIKLALNIEPDHVNANNVAGLIYPNAKNPTLASAHFQKALSAAPNDASTLNNYGNFLCNAGNIDQAEQVFLRAATNPNNPNPEIAYTNLGLCSLRIPDNEKASRYLTTALDFEEENAIAYFHLANINLQKGLGQPALERLRSYASYAKHTPQTLKLGIEIARLLQDKETESSFFTQLQSEFPSSKEYQWAIQ